MSPEADDIDTELAERLDQYLSALQANDFPRCQQLLHDFPALREFVEAFDLLDRLSPDVGFASTVWNQLQDSQPINEPVDPASAQTMILDPNQPLPTPVLNNTPPVPDRQQFGRFELMEELGRGGMGVVFRARQMDLDRIVAVKMILVNRLASAADIRRFYQEAKAAGRLSHPHIVGIHEVGEHHGQHYFSMDCIEGPSLADLLAQGPAASNDSHSDVRQSALSFDGTDARYKAAGRDSLLTFEQVARILRDVARAVGYLHSQGIVHRDLKPSNILISSVNGLPYLTDFGLAKCVAPDADNTNSGMIIGTPLYMSPEQAAARSSEVGPQSDIYSLGAILYQALTGRAPHQGSSPMQTIVRVIETEPELPRSSNFDAPRELEAICLRCLEKNPVARYASAEELAEELERYLRGEPVQARSSGVVHRFRRWIRRDPALASRWAALFGASLILYGALWIDEITVDKHWYFQRLIAIWAVSASLFQAAVKQPTIARVARFTWLASDAAFLTRLLIVAGHPVGPLLVTYPLLIAAAGLFFHEELVYFMTAVSLVSYAILLWCVPQETSPPHYCLIFSAVLIVIGLVLAHQVHRIRNISRHFDA